MPRQQSSFFFFRCFLFLVSEYLLEFVRVTHTRLDTTAQHVDVPTQLHFENLAGGGQLLDLGSLDQSGTEDCLMFYIFVFVHSSF